MVSTGGLTGGDVVGAEWHVLTWDSEFFGIPIARIDLTAGDAAAIAAAEGDAADAGMTCLYGELDPRAVEAIDLVQRLGYRLMEVAIELEHPTNVVHDPPPTTSRVRAGSIEDTPGLAEHIAAVAPWSRYAVDPRFGLSAALAMHRAWVERAAGPEPGRMLLLAEDRGKLTGMATVCGADPASAGARAGPRVDLISSTQPGSGAAQALLAHAFAAFGPGPSRGGPIAARNVVALRFCEQMGYRVAGSRYLFHRWLDEVEPAAADSSGFTAAR